MTNAIQLLAVASRFAVAAAIVYFAFQLSRIVDSLPEIDTTMGRVTKEVSPTVEAIERVRLEVAEVRKLVPQVLAESAAVRAQIPSVLAEVEQVRNSIAPVLDEVSEIRRQIPPLLQRIDESVAVADQTQRQIPAILDTADRAIASVDATRAQIGPLVPEVLTEIRLTREKVDPTLDRVDGMIEDAYFRARDTIATAQGAGQEASEGAVKGLFTGILKLPFKLIGTLASPIVNSIKPDVARQLTQEDVDLMGEAGKRASDSGRLDQAHQWENPDSGKSGSITLIRRFKLEQSDCVEARITINDPNKRILDKLESYCRNTDGEWAATAAPAIQK